MSVIGVNLISETPQPGWDPNEDRLDPAVLTRDAEWLLSKNEDLVPFIASLLRTIRENDDRQNAIRDGYGSSYRQLEEEHRRVCDERNDYREALRAVIRATRHIRVGRL